MLRLKWENVQKKCIVYYRKKTETTQTINKRPERVALNEVVQQSLDKLGKKDNPFVLGLLKEGYSENTINNKSNKDRLIINRHLRSIEVRLKLSAPLRLSSARDCYATCLKRAGTPTQIISEQLVHSSVSVTENYLGSMNIEELVKINSVIY
jgi:integrase